MRGPVTKSTTRARSLRRRSTRAEWVLWLELRNRRLGGLKLARQQPIGRYYVDFVCRERRLVIEVDGGQHSDNLADRDREADLVALGYRVVRVWNNDVLANIVGVLEFLLSELEQAPSPCPSPRRRGEGTRLNRHRDTSKIIVRKHQKISLSPLAGRGLG